MSTESKPAEAAGDDPEALAEAKKLLGKREWPVTLMLGTPVAFGKETVESLLFQKGNFGILKGLGLSIDRAPNLDELMMIASRLSGRPLKVIELLDPDDADEVIAIALGFFARCRGAGKMLSG
jgi:hypothetical protein